MYFYFKNIFKIDQLSVSYHKKGQVLIYIFMLLDFFRWTLTLFFLVPSVFAFLYVLSIGAR